MFYFLYDVCNFLYILKLLENFAFAFTCHASCHILVSLYVIFPCVLLLPFLGLRSDKLSHPYNTRVNQLKKMDHLEQKNCELREEVTTLRERFERLTAMMEVLVASHNQLPPPQTPPQRTMISEIIFMPILMDRVCASQHHIPLGFPWGMPPQFVPKGY